MVFIQAARGWRGERSEVRGQRSEISERWAVGSGMATESAKGAKGERRWVMALQTTRDAVRSILKTDPTCSADDRQRVLDAMSGKAVAASGETVKAPPPRIVRFQDAAKRLGCHVHLLHQLAHAGAIRKCKLPGRVRCHGILAEDLERLLAEGVRVVRVGEKAEG